MQCVLRRGARLLGPKRGSIRRQDGRLGPPAVPLRADNGLLWWLDGGDSGSAGSGTGFWLGLGHGGVLLAAGSGKKLLLLLCWLLILVLVDGFGELLLFSD